MTKTEMREVLLDEYPFQAEEIESFLSTQPDTVQMWRNHLVLVNGREYRLQNRYPYEWFYEFMYEKLRDEDEKSANRWFCYEWAWAQDAQVIEAIRANNPIEVLDGLVIPVSSVLLVETRMEDRTDALRPLGYAETSSDGEQEFVVGIVSNEQNATK